MVVLAAVALITVGGAGARTAPSADRPARAAIDALLRSQGIDPASVVKQVGLRNYAGPNCPGRGWNCTTATRVVQLATAAGENEFVCNPAAAGSNAATNTCVVVQHGTDNVAHCTESTSAEPLASLSCDVTQSGTTNVVEITQRVTQSHGPLQLAGLRAAVTQDGIDKNVAVVHQDVRQATTLGMVQTQNAFERADVTQRVSSGQNYSHVHQTQDQDESGAATSQNQNTGANAAFECGAEKPTQPNECANVKQFAAHGATNVSHLHQLTGERQTSTALAPTQTQGSAQDGQEGDVHQENPPGVGENLNFPTQDLRQLQTSPGGVAIQRQLTDPGCCGVGTEVGGATTNEDIDQATTQSADEATATQIAMFLGETRHLTAADTHDQCAITQQAQNNGGGETIAASGHSPEQCAALTVATTCSYPSHDGTCVSTATCASCTESPLPPTHGSAISMPSYGTEPANYFPPSP